MIKSMIVFHKIVPSIFLKSFSKKLFQTFQTTPVTMDENPEATPVAEVILLPIQPQGGDIVEKADV